ncbi:MAG: hypothetical protein NZM15_01615 [Flavobacteriales bacterium]|nr:hypothetical protein [Flavobacteriales bacterium]MDW8431381.1 hypothetical protein [Flavobacteriales bacterium]
MGWISGAVWLVLCGAWIMWAGRHLTPRVSQRWLGGLWALKIAAGFAIWWIYAHYYSDEKTGDIISYHADGLELRKIFWQSPLKYVQVLLGMHNNYEEEFAPLYNTMRYWYEEWKGSNLIIEPRNMIRLSSLVGLLTGGWIFSHIVVFSCLAMLGILFLTAGFRSAGIFSDERWLMAGATLAPSALAWTSAPMREAPMMLGLGMAVAGAVWVRRNLSFKAFATLLGGFWWLAYFKTHVALTLFMPVVLYLLAPADRRQALVLYGGSLLALLIFLYATPSGAFVLKVVAKKRIDFIHVAEVWEARSRIPVPEVPQRLEQLPQSVAHALTNTFFQPMPWRVKGLLDSLALGENILFSALLALSLWRIWRFQNLPLNFVMLVVLFSFFQALLIGLTTSVAGAIVRYKCSILAILTPFLLLSLQPKNARETKNLKTDE